MKSPCCILVLVFCLFTISSANSFNHLTTSPSTKRIGPNGGSITSSDGAVTLTFPAGALSAEETIMITKISIDDLGPEFEELESHYSIGSVYELSPDGLEFDSPVFAEFTSNQKGATRNGKTELEAEILVSSRNGVLSVLGNAGTRLHSDSKVTVYGELEGFSKLVQVRDLGYSVSNLTREDIEQTPGAGRTLESIISITPKINLDNENNNTLSIRQTYQRPLSFSDVLDIEAIEVQRGPQGALFGTGRTFQYSYTDNGSAFLQSNVRFQFPDDMPVDIFRDINYEMTLDSFVNCEIPDEQVDDFEFNITDLNSAFDNTPGRLSLNFSYKISPEIVENSYFKIDWGDGNINTYELTGPETTWGGNGSRDNFRVEDTHQFSVEHQSNLAGKFDIRVEAWGHEEPETLNNKSRLDQYRDSLFINKILNPNKFLNREWNMNRGDSFDSIIEKNITKQISDRFTFGPEVNIVPRAPTVYTTDGHLQMKWNNYERFIENLPAAIPNFSVEKIDIFENFWIYQLNYPNEFTERFDLTPSFFYSEFPNEEGNQPLEIELNLDQAMPIIIQLDELWNPVLIDDINSFDPNHPTRLITPTLFEQLQQQQKVFDFEETTVEIPGYTLRIVKDGNGSGTVEGFSDVWKTFPLIDCGRKCTNEFIGETEVMLLAKPDLWSEFVGYSENTTNVFGGVSNVTVEEHTTVTATFIKKEREDVDLESALPDSITLDDTGSIRGQVVEKDGGALPGTTVELTNVSGTVRRTTVTNAEGRYRFLRLPKGNYTVTAGLEGFLCWRSSTEPILDMFSFGLEENNRLFEVNFECVRAEEDPQEDSTTAPLFVDSGQIIRDRAWFWFPGGFQMDVKVGYPFRPTVIDYVEDQVDLKDADVSGFKPMYGFGAEIDLLKKDRWTSSLGVHLGRSGYDYSQSFNNGTQVDGEVGVTNLNAYAKFRRTMRSNLNEQFYNNVIQNLKRPKPYLMVGLNTVFNNNKIKIRNSFQENIENIERNHTGYNFVAGIGFESRILKNLSYSLGVDANIGKADTYISPSFGLSYVNINW